MGQRIFSREEVKSHILYKLARKRRWGAKHTELKNVSGSLPSEHACDAQNLAKELANDGFLTWLKKTGEIHVSLNAHKRKEILELIEKYHEKQYW